MKIIKFEKATKRFHDYFEKDIRYLFTFFVILASGGFLLDLLINYDKYGEIILIIDGLAFLVIILFYFLAVNRIISVQLSHLTINYILLILLSVLYYIQISNGEFKAYNIIQDLISIPFIIVSIGLIVSKRHMFIFGIIVSIVYTLVMYFSNDKYLIDSIVIIFGVLIGSTFAFALFFYSIENSLEKREKIEQKLAKQKEELKEVNLEKDKLFSLIAHDLHGPVFMASKMIGIVLTSPLSVTEKEEILTAVKNSLDKSSSVLLELLDFTQNKPGMFVFSPENLNLYHTTKEVLKLFEATFNNKKINVFNRIPTRIYTFSDKLLLVSILRNIFVNIVKLSEENAKLFIDANYGDKGVEIEITCEGIKQAGSLLRQMFSDNFGDTTLLENEDNRRLFGINLIKDFTEKNGGEMSIEINDNEIKFYLTAPLGSA